MTFLDTWDSGDSWDVGEFWDNTQTIIPYSIPYYLNLLTSEYQNKPNAIGTVAVSVQPFSDTINLLKNLWQYFNIDTAIGDQLTKLGNLVGVSRYVETPITGYFSLDSATLGLDQAPMQGPTDPSYGLISLPDTTYRNIVKCFINLNKWDGTLLGLYSCYTVYYKQYDSNGNLIVDINGNPILSSYNIFSPGTLQIVIGSKKITYQLTAAPSDTIISSLFSSGYFCVAPAGIAIGTPVIL